MRPTLRVQVAFAVAEPGLRTCLDDAGELVLHGFDATSGQQRIECLFGQPDGFGFHGSGHFTRGMDMLVDKDNLGFGLRSWRYSMQVEDGEIVQLFIEPGKIDDCPEDPFEVSDVDTMLNYLRGLNETRAA